MPLPLSFWRDDVVVKGAMKPLEEGFTAAQKSFSRQIMDETALTVTFISRNPEETVALGKLLGATLQAGDVLALVGELGAGKTRLTQGIARGLDVADHYQITSPTFTLINEYPGRLPFVHLDVYRLAGSAEMVDLGYEEYFFGGGVTVIEWAEKIQDILPQRTLSFKLTYLDQSTRKIEISGHISRMAQIAETLKDGGF
jgi:tRNA threonylcarbamoyladenosine biosynthesis protein TsaE